MALQYFCPVTPMYHMFSKAKRKYGLFVLLPDYRKAMCYIIFEGQFRCWLDLSILISAQKCFSDNSCPVLDINAYLFPTGKILTCKAAKKRASIHGTDLGMRTLSKELEVPSNPKLSTPPDCPCQRTAVPGCTHKGAERRRPAHPKGGRALFPPTPICTEHLRSRKKT